MARKKGFLQKLILPYHIEKNNGMKMIIPPHLIWYYIHKITTLTQDLLKFKNRHADLTITMESLEFPIYWDHKLEDIPTLKSSKLRLFSALEDDATDIKDIERIIISDPAMSAKIVKIANSPFYRHEAKIKGMHEAILTIGLDMVKCITLSMSIMESFGASTKVANRLWTHSYSVGLLALSLGKNKEEREWLFSGGLLHDLGKMVLLYLEPDLYTPLFNKGWPGIEDEQQILSTDHTQLGEFVAKRWHFPQEVVNIIRHHHKPTERSSAIIYVVDHVVHSLEDKQDVWEKDLKDVEPFLGPDYKTLVNKLIEGYSKCDIFVQTLI